MAIVAIRTYFFPDFLHVKLTTKYSEYLSREKTIKTTTTK